MTYIQELPVFRVSCQSAVCPTTPGLFYHAPCQSAMRPTMPGLFCRTTCSAATCLFSCLLGVAPMCVVPCVPSLRIYPVDSLEFGPFNQL